MTDHQLEQRLKNHIDEERRITNEILKLITEAATRGLHLKRGYSSLFEWLTQGLGYSAGAAHRRIESATLVRVVPEAEAKLASGKITLTNLAKARSSIRASEKASGTKMAAEDQASVVAAIENKTTAEAELVLLQLLPETAVVINRERSKRLDADTERLTINLTNEDMENLAWIKDFLSHAMPEATNGQLIGRAIADFRERHANSQANVRRLKIERQSCEFRDEETGKVCGSTYQVEEDHIVPRALGGSDEPSNKRCLCRRHNLYVAEQWLGKAWANSWREA